MSNGTFQAKRVVRAYRQTIEAKPDVVFPLLCPVREAEWLDGWSYSMIFSASGLVEEGAVFSTSNPGEDDTIWIVTRHDSAMRTVEFARFTPHSRTCFLKIAVSALGQDRSHVDVSYAYTSLSEVGSQFFDTWTEKSFQEALGFWERSMNHYLKTGKRLLRVTG